MSENLKVNANSSVLEHKRKHNLLVDAVPVKDTDGNYKIFENIVDTDGNKVYEYFDASVSSGDWEQEGLTYVSTFIKVIRNFGELQFIFNCRITNSTDSSITIANDKRMCNFSGIPDYLKAKIYAHNGNNCSTPNQGSIAFCSLFISETAGGISASNQRYANLYSSSNDLTFYNEGGAIVIASGSTLDFEARISLAI